MLLEYDTRVNGWGDFSDGRVITSRSHFRSGLAAMAE